MDRWRERETGGGGRWERRAGWLGGGWWRNKHTVSQISRVARAASLTTANDSFGAQREREREREDHSRDGQTSTQGDREKTEKAGGKSKTASQAKPEYTRRQHTSTCRTHAEVATRGGIVSVPPSRENVSRRKALDSLGVTAW